VLRAAKVDFRNVTRATVYLTDLGNFQTLNSIYGEYFGDHKPARSTVGVAQLPRGAAVEIDLIATSS
jgi:2-iminobutanoate/2-iminopropanoate deaminase